MSQSPRILSAEQHRIPASSIDINALKVLNRLHEHGFRACLVGGGVRDLMLGREPKDFDVATDASPEQVRQLFRNARLIGRRFRLAHVRYGRDIIEVATFRAPHEEAERDGQGQVDENGRISRDNVYGTLEQDVWRRDFSINALYYDIADRSVIDYTGGVDDLASGVLRMIGDPELRYREDPVRMLRAIRFAAKLGFRIDPASESVIHDLNELMAEASPARLFEEFLKLMHGGCAQETFELLRHYQLFRHLFPETSRCLGESEGEFFGGFISNALGNTDQRIQAGQPVTPAFLIAVMLWGPVMQRRQALTDNEGLPPVAALHQAAQEIFSEQSHHVSIPRRFSSMAKEIWELQRRLHNTRGKRPQRLVEHPRFRAGYDFLCLRARSGEDELQPLCDWWTDFQASDPVAKKAAAAKHTGSYNRHKRPRRRKPAANG